MIAGIDTHKDTLAVAVIDALGRPVTREEVPNNERGFGQLAALLRAHTVDRVGIEGSGCYGRAVAIHLAMLECVEVVDVPPSETAQERKNRPGQGKTDPIDALAIARVTAREKPLPPVRLTIGPAADLRALSDYREQLVEERRQLVNRIHAELAGLRPGYHHDIPHLTQPGHLRKVRLLLAGNEQVRAALLLRRLDRIDALDSELRALRKQIIAAVEATGTSLQNIYGIGPLIAARIIGEVVDIRRYPTRHAFASANGTAPIPASSGRTVRHRLNSGGNRRLNRCLYIIALTEIRADTEGRAYYRRKRAEGKSGREAIRCLKRRLSDVIYRTLLTDVRAMQAPASGAAAAA